MIKTILAIFILLPAIAFAGTCNWRIFVSEPNEQYSIELPNKLPLSFNLPKNSEPVLRCYAYIVDETTNNEIFQKVPIECTYTKNTSSSVSTTVDLSYDPNKNDYIEKLQGFTIKVNISAGCFSQIEH